MSKAKNKSKKTLKKNKPTTQTRPVEKKPDVTTTVDKQPTKPTKEEITPKPNKPQEIAPQTKTETPNKTPSIWQNPDFRAKFFTIFWSMTGIVVVILTVFVGFPALFDQTEAAQVYREEQETEERLAREEEERKKQEEEENPIIAGDNRRVQLTTNFGDIVVETKPEAAPKSVENFLRLTYRDYYDQTIFHRMVEKPDFAVIQGGDPTGTGSGGESAFGPTATVPDELWEVEPEFETNEAGETVLSNEPELQGDNLYKDFDTDTGFVIYPKGSVVMAKTNAPNSATSQFFITLADTSLPAQYTIFAVVLEEDLEVLDKILAEVDPVAEANVDGTVTDPDDGKPSQEIRLEKAELLPA
jgi:peptidyl-prolyl cis-trans isomerase B (cyclophilin B)